ncbi:MAG: selenocysteine-specific translation elongation factor [Anaerolineae bacterium]
MRVIGTAGHVDHGKSTLVKALTGIDPDRLKEEKERAMTIDLGFAWVTLPSGETVGVVDVPGHQDFIKNMLAGVGGIDAALLVVAADEGVMPQTREHLSILDLLKVWGGLVAITKADLVGDEDWLELVQADVAETLDGTVLEGARILPLSATTGQGIEELRQALDEVLAQAPPRPDRGRPRLPIDRVFTVSGFGTVVTGTLIDGRLQIGQEVEVLPKGLKARIRGLQSHKKKVEVAVPGSRVAINLSGVDKVQLARGDVVTLPGWLEPSQLIDTRLRLLPDAPKPVKHNQQVEVFAGASETPAHLRLLGMRSLNPGEEGWVQLRLLKRIPVVRGDHFIVRQASPSLTVGGGVIVDPLPRRRHRRFRRQVLARLETLASGTPADLLLETLDREGPQPVRQLIANSPFSPEGATAALRQLLETGDAFALSARLSPNAENLAASKEIIASRAGWSALFGRLASTLSDYHHRYPLRAGMPRGEMKSRLKLETRLFNEIIAYAARNGALALTETHVRLPDYVVEYTPAQQQAVEALLARFKKAPYNTPSYKDCLLALGGDEELLGSLVESGVLLRLNPDVLLLGSTFDEFLAWLREFIERNGSITVAGLRDAFNTSRKYALALLEFTDAQGITRRQGDERVLR